MFWRVLSVPLFGRSEESPLSLGNSSGMFDSSGTAVRYSMVGCWWRRWEEWLGAMSGTMVRKLVAVAWHRLALSQFGFSLGRVGATLPSLTLLFFVWWVETGCSSLPQESGCREDAFDRGFWRGGRRDGGSLVDGMVSKEMLFGQSLGLVADSVWRRRWCHPQCCGLRRSVLGAQRRRFWCCSCITRASRNVNPA